MENDDSFQSCDEKDGGQQESEGEEETKEVVECPYPRKDHYSNYEILTGRCPGYESEKVVTRVGWVHDTNVRWKADPYYGPQRFDMPYHRPQNAQKLVSFLKNLIGKDLTSISFPISFSEPLSMLQRFTEFSKPVNIVETASKFEDSLE